MIDAAAISSHVLVVEHPDAGHPRFAPALEDAGYRVSRANSTDEIRHFTDGDSTFAAVIAQLSDESDAVAAALRILRYSNPHIPTFVVGGPPDALERLTVERFARDTSPGEVLDVVGQRLATHNYDNTIVDALADVAIGCLTLHIPDLVIHRKDAFLRYDARMLGEMTAMIDVMGDGLVGKSMLSGPTSWFEAQSRSMLRTDNPNRAMISDAAAEMSNLVAARIRTHYLGRGIDSRMGTPTVFGGSDVFVRIYSPRSSLVLSFTSETLEGELYCEWLLERKAEDKIGENPVLDAGELEFF